MPKTDKELQDLKVKVEKLDSKLRELSADELKQVAGGRLASSTYNNHLAKSIDVLLEADNNAPGTNQEITGDQKESTGGTFWQHWDDMAKIWGS